jgi:DnaJ-class molecular chaperone
MSWLDKLLGRECHNPELYDRVPCKVCGGRGVIVPSATPADPRYGSMRVRTCGGCRGTGYVLQRKPEP